MTGAGIGCAGDAGTAADGGAGAWGLAAGIEHAKRYPLSEFGIPR
jgi:hypothetical protein